MVMPKVGPSPAQASSALRCSSRPKHPLPPGRRQEPHALPLVPPVRPLRAARTEPSRSAQGARASRTSPRGGFGGGADTRSNGTRNRRASGEARGRVSCGCQLGRAIGLAAVWVRPARGSFGRGSWPALWRGGRPYAAARPPGRWCASVGVFSTQCWPACSAGP